MLRCCRHSLTPCPILNLPSPLPTQPSTPWPPPAPPSPTSQPPPSPPSPPLASSPSHPSPYAPCSCQTAHQTPRMQRAPWPQQCWARGSARCAACRLAQLQRSAGERASGCRVSGLHRWGSMVVRGAAPLGGWLASVLHLRWLLSIIE